MVAIRSSSLRALRQISQQCVAVPAARRSLHITGIQSAQPLNSADAASLYGARTLPDLKSECIKRSLGATGSKSELVERLSNHDLLQSRAFSIAMRSINSNAFSSPSSRQFNTSRASKAVGDSSTVDFIYMPSFAELEAAPVRSAPQIPVFPDMSSLHSTSSPAPPMKPRIYTAAGASTVSAGPSTEVVDNFSVDIDPLAETFAKSEQQSVSTSSPETGFVKELWSGFLDDVMGPKQSHARH
ncbi:hypothetical protein N7495_000523 [Penicillium taxi]|uniref:uncharacterized protein n=1 Tax=Penicillium taxi TaxID=168475 RepID=UPI0025450AA7|nr:uncharacterized protein N7495_000523 [Penicillium taxi]KAJ5907841.1 hypothetical protein N7495_000523 [Penicillium taxi]